MTFTTYDNQLEELELQLEAMDRAQLAALFANHRLALSKYSKGWLEAAEAAASEERKAATLRRLQAQVDRIQERWLKHQQRIRTERESILGDVQRLLEGCAKQGIEVDIQLPARMDLSGVQKALEEASTPAPVEVVEEIEEGQLHLLIQEVLAA